MERNPDSREDEGMRTKLEMLMIYERLRDELEMFTVYHSPRDYPDKFVVRRRRIGRKTGEPLADADWFYLADTLEEVRRHIPGHCVRLERDPRDEPQIVECWI
jgi:hypothetical protein